MKTLIIGVDPGLTGAVAVYDLKRKNLISVRDMPVKLLPNGKYGIDAFTTAEYMGQYKGQVLGAVIEEVGAAPGQGVVSMFNFGMSAGIITGVIATLGGDIHLTKPAVWKSILGLSHDKQKSLDLATDTFPHFAEFFRLKKHDGRAEAALLAKYGERLRWQ